MQPLVGSCLDGYNATVLAYGQTGSGKSYTMGSEDTMGVLMSDKRGIIPRWVQSSESKVHSENIMGIQESCQSVYKVQIQSLKSVQ